MAATKFPALSAYAAGRDALLRSLVAGLSTDKRFAAAWLTGSFGRSEQDDVSDLDLSVLTTPVGSELLVDTALRGGTSGARRLLFEQFGVPLVIHENPYNAPPGGSFSAVVYREGPYTVDWALLAPAQPQRPHDSLLLFDHGRVAVLPPSDATHAPALSARLDERWSYFWMMALVAAKYWLRRDEVLVVVMLDQLERVAEEIRVLAFQEPPRYRAKSHLPLPRSRQEQGVALQRVCGYVDGLLPQVTAVTASLVESGEPAVEALVRLG